MGSPGGQFLLHIGRPSQAFQIMFHSRPELASTLKSHPSSGLLPYRRPRDSPATWLSFFSGLHLLRLPTPHPGFGSITLSRGRAQASCEEAPWRCTREGRVPGRGAPLSSDTPGLAKARTEGHLSRTPAPGRGDQGGGEEAPWLPREADLEAGKAGSLVGLRPRPHRAGGTASRVPLRGRPCALNEPRVSQERQALTAARQRGGLDA